MVSLVKKEDPGTLFLIAALQKRRRKLVECKPVLRPSLSGEESNHLGTMSGFGADGIGCVGCRAEFMETGGEKSYPSEDGGAREWQRGKKSLGEGEGIGENHSGLAFSGGC